MKIELSEFLKNRLI